MGLSVIVPYHWVSWWLMKWRRVVQKISNGCHGMRKDENQNQMRCICTAADLGTRLKSPVIMCFLGNALCYHYIAPSWPCLDEWQEGSPPVACHGGTLTTMQGLQPALAQSGRQSLLQPLGLFGKPCWIAHFVCGIRAGGKAAPFADTSVTSLPTPWQSTAVWCNSECVRGRDRKT